MAFANLSCLAACVKATKVSTRAKLVLWLIVTAISPLSLKIARFNDRGFHFLEVIAHVQKRGQSLTKQFVRGRYETISIQDRIHISSFDVYQFSRGNRRFRSHNNKR